VYGGAVVGHFGSHDADEEPSHGRPYSLSLTETPLGIVAFRAPIAAAAAR
jgi:hypothetical protein